MPATAAPPRPDRRIEVIGASDTAGYGVDGPADYPTKKPRPNEEECTLEMVKYENCDESYGAVLAREFGAELANEGWAGKGLIRNAASSLPQGPPLPGLWDRALGTHKEPAWNFSTWTPQLVTISLGGNDINHQKKPAPTYDVFAAAYAAFLSHIFDVYHAADPAP
eukprot:gene7763-3267_t